MVSSFHYSDLHQTIRMKAERKITMVIMETA